MQMHSAKTAKKQPMNLGKTLMLPPVKLLLQVKSIVSCPFRARFVPGPERSGRTKIRAAKFVLKQIGSW
jgi:hypothetical protein